MAKVPREALSISHTSTGLLPDTSLSLSQGTVSSRIVILTFRVSRCNARGWGHLCFWPVTIVTPQGIDLRYVFAVMFVWGGLCGLIPYFLRNRFGIYLHY